MKYKNIQDDPAQFNTDSTGFLKESKSMSFLLLLMAVITSCNTTNQYLLMIKEQVSFAVGGSVITKL